MDTPTIPPLVYLRGRGAPDRVWDRVRTAMHTRGWVTVSDRACAWHLQRGGATVAMCDFSATLDRTPSPWFGYDRYVRVGLVRARYCPDKVRARLGDALPATEWARLANDPSVGYAVLDAPTWARSGDQEFVWLSLVEPDRPYRACCPEEMPADPRVIPETLDEEKLAELVAEAFAAGKTLPAPQPLPLDTDGGEEVARP